MDGFVRRTARYLLQVAIEAEATAFLGRGHYRRGDRARAGWRNGYEPKAVQTEAGLLKFAVPQQGALGVERALAPALMARAMRALFEVTPIDGEHAVIVADAIGPRV